MHKRAYLYIMKEMIKIRSANGYGTIVCLDKTGKKRRKPWAVRVTVGWEDGKQKTKYIGYYEKQKDAKLALANYHNQGISVDANSITFGQVFELWKDRNEGKLTTKNLGAYESAYKLVPQLHDKKLKDLKSQQLQDAMDNIDKKYATKSKVKTLMKQMYELAMMDDLVLKDYSAAIDLKCVQEDVGKVYTREEIKHLWDIAGESELAEDILILIYTGMRIGEALECVSPKADFHIEDGYFECHGTKTKSADRAVPIHPDILPLLEKRKDRQWLFLNQTGQQAKYRAFSYAYVKMLDDLGWEHIIHDTRKTFATVLHENDIADEDIKAIVGHSQSGVTHKTYVKHRIENLVEKISKVTFV